ASAPLPPSKVLEGKYLYNFIGWSEEFDEITSNLNIYPVYEEIEKQFKVTFIDGNGQIVKEVFVSYGLNATPPVDATKNPTEDEYFLFTGWSGSYINVIQDQIIYATFRKVDRWYQVNFIGKNNELLNTQVIEYGKG